MAWEVQSESRNSRILNISAKTSLTVVSSSSVLTHEDNGDDKQFACQDFEYEANYNAAKDIANRYCGYIHHGRKSRSGYPTSQLTLKSETLNADGDYTPTELFG
jgi:hypothetical protein